MMKPEMGKDAKEEKMDGDSSSSEVEEYSVEKITKKRLVKEKLEYIDFKRKFLKLKGENTWEPIFNLDCPDLIQEFEDKLKKKKEEKRSEKSRDEKPSSSKKKRPSNASASTSKETKKEDERPTPAKNTKKEEKADSVTEHVPKGFDRKLEPKKIIGATDSSGSLMFLMQWKGTDEKDLVPAKEANLKCPQIVIQFYEERLVWYDPPSEETSGLYSGA